MYTGHFQIRHRAELGLHSDTTTWPLAAAACTWRATVGDGAWAWCSRSGGALRQNTLALIRHPIRRHTGIRHRSKLSERLEDARDVIFNTSLWKERYKSYDLHYQQHLTIFLGEFVNEYIAQQLSVAMRLHLILFLSFSFLGGSGGHLQGT